MKHFFDSIGHIITDFNGKFRARTCRHLCLLRQAKPACLPACLPAQHLESKVRVVPAPCREKKTLVALNRRFLIENRAIQNRAIRIVRFQGRLKYW